MMMKCLNHRPVTYIWHHWARQRVHATNRHHEYNHIKATNSLFLSKMIAHLQEV